MRWGIWPLRSRKRIARASQSRRSERRPALESLEARQLLDAASPVADIVMLGSMTQDSQQVVVDYEVQGAPIDEPISLAVYRSADDQFDPSDQLIATYQISAPQDLGAHQVTIPIPDGLTINPRHPYVLTVANPDGALAESDFTNNTTSFRKQSIVIVTHGGLQDTPGDRIPAWANRMSGDLGAQGFDVVFPFNWVGVSKSPGSAAKQGPRLAMMVRRLVDELPSDQPIDLHFIGHSEGAVVNSLALKQLEKDTPSQVSSGFIKLTMLDPHAANNAFPRQQYSVKDSFMGNIARRLVNEFQAKAKDPFVNVPAIVDDAEVFYQHTYFAMAKSSTRESQWLNLWGQVPVYGPGEASYTNLTGPGISHSGDFSVVDWYHVNVVPTLGNGQGFPKGSLIKGQLDPQDGPTTIEERDPRRRPLTADIPTPLKMVSQTSQPTFLGTAPAGSDVWLIGAGEGRRFRLGKTTSDTDGQWRIDSPRLANGRYKVIVRGIVPASPVLPRVAVSPNFVLGTLSVQANHQKRR